jgi:hypothetical protein
VGALAYFVIVRGPRAYVAPDDAPETAPEPGETGDDEQPRRAPKAYQLVSEHRFEEYRRTGVLPPDTEADRALEIAAGGHPADPEDPAGPAGKGEAVLATGAAAGTGPDGVTGGDADVDGAASRPADEN